MVRRVVYLMAFLFMYGCIDRAMASTCADVSGSSVVISSTVPPCASGQVVLLDTFDYQTINPAPSDILYVFSWGFGAVVFFFFSGFGIAVALRAIGFL